MGDQVWEMGDKDRRWVTKFRVMGDLVREMGEMDDLLCVLLHIGGSYNACTLK
jgi:hypothetical protein